MRQPATPTLFPYTTLFRSAKLPLAPLLGGVKVTVTPFTGVPLALVTVTTKGAGKGELIAALCGVPLVAVILDRKSTRLNSSHITIPYAVTTLKVTVKLPDV